MPIHDLIVQGDELVLATHGRSFWILDDLTPLRRMAEGSAPAAVTLFPPRPTHRIMAGRANAPAVAEGLNFRRVGPLTVTYRERKAAHGAAAQTYYDAGQNPPDGVQVHYYLSEQPRGAVKLAFLDSAGAVIASFTSAAANGAPAKEEPAPVEGEVPRGLTEGEEGAAPELEEAETPPSATLRAPAAAGLNRFVWNMRHPEARQLPDENTLERFVVPGPLAAPGAYRVRLTVDGQTREEPFTLLKDPRLATTDEDFAAQLGLLLQIRDKLSEVHDAVARLRDIRQQVEGWTRRTAGQEHGGRVAEAARGIAAHLDEIEGELIQVRAASALSFPARLKEKLATLTMVVSNADAAPTAQAREVFASLRERVDRQVARLDGVVGEDLAAFNALLREAAVPAVVPLPAGAGARGQ